MSKNELVTEEKILATLKTLKESQPEDETIEVQITIKGYDFKKDKKFDSDVELPFMKRKKEKILFIADETHRELATKLDIPFMSFADAQGTNREKKVLKRKTAGYYHTFIVFGAFNKNFELKYFVQKRKPFYILKTKDELENLYNKVKNTIKFKLRKTPDLSFCSGYLGLTDDQIVSNFNDGLNFLITLLKKKEKNIKGLAMKSTNSKSIRLL